MHRLLPLLVGLVLSGSGHAGDWPAFRGPTGQGHSPERNLPISWSVDQGIRWKIPVPGEGWSSPIVQGDRVFLTTVTEGQTQCRILAFDRLSGRMLWNVVVSEMIPLRKESKNSYASPTPIAHGDRVFAVFGDGTMVAVEAATGALLWKNAEVRFYSRHGLGASPILHAGRLIMPFDGSNRVEKAGDWPNNTEEEQLGWRIPWDRAEIVALDIETGRRVWTARRGRSRIAHVTPTILAVGGQPQLISPAGDAIQGFNPRTGELLWTVYSQGEGVTPSVVTGNGLVFTASGFERTTLRTVRPDGRGDVTSTHIAWEQRRGAPTQPSPIFVHPHLHTITDGGVAHGYDAATGDVLYSERVGGNHSASPVHADGHLYFLSENGVATVIRTGPEFVVVSRNALDDNERFQASMAVSQGHLFIRSDRHLYCIGR
ncbi:MAG: PQQ-binding-like beta-propeller repeat protein [Verrucomicrobiae bacterium]|nr:PQQ-binding-like beta-propeller repeat protein [Verrucomicrobiae bacterium]